MYPAHEVTPTIFLRGCSMTEKDKKTATPSYFSRKIGNTTFVVSVSFSETATESIVDKILKLVASDSQNKEVQKCG